jgi:diadenylate cyclase
MRFGLGVCLIQVCDDASIGFNYLLQVRDEEIFGSTARFRCAMTEVLGQLRWQDGLDIGIIWYLIYRLLQMLRGSRAMQMMIGLAVVLMAYVLSRGLGLFTLNWILDNFLASIILVIIVIFQSDIRRALTQVGTAPIFGAEKMVQRREDIIEEVTDAVRNLASRRVGALIVLEREVGLNEYIEIGTRLDARVSRELIESVFLPGSPIHDGALVIQKRRVTAVRCLLPLSANPNLRTTMGTRHRAAIGVTEETDAVAIVVSEQEGTIALVVGGNLTERIEASRLRNALEGLVKL